MRDTSSTRSAYVLRRTSPILYLACGALMVGILGIDLVTPSGLAMGVPYVAAVLLSLWSPKIRFIVIIAIACTAYTLVAILHKPSYGELWTIIYDRSLALFAIWVTASLAIQKRVSEEKRERAIIDREKALEDVRVLRGLLPICASCKQIRDDEGYWTQIEVYIRDHSEAKFSHGMCPACARKAYPEYFETHRREPGFDSLIDRR